MDHPSQQPTATEPTTTAPDGAQTQASSAQASLPHIVVGEVRGMMLFDRYSERICVKQMPLPGVVIFVHGVNSEGEWFEAAEEDICKGLN